MTAAPDMTPRAEPAELAWCDIPHSAPFLCDLRAADAEAGTIVPHVRNTEYVRWLDRAAQLHADHLGYTHRWLLDRGIMWFVARHEIDYGAEVWPGDELIVATWVRDMQRVRSWRDYLICRPRDNTVVCRAATLWVLVNLETRRPVRIADDMIERFAPLQPAEIRCTSA